MEANWYHHQQNSGSVTNRNHQCGQDAEATMAGLLLGVNHTSLCKGSYSSMFSQVSEAARPLTTWLLWPLLSSLSLV